VTSGVGVTPGVDLGGDSGMRHAVMNNKLYAIIGSLVSGAFIAILMQLNASLGKEIGVLESSFVAHFVGTLLSFIFVVKNINLNILKKTFDGPKYLLLGGVFGVMLVVISNIVIPKLGMLVTLSLVITADIIFSTIADQFGIFSLPKFKVNRGRIFGLVASLIGLALVFWR